MKPIHVLMMPWFSMKDMQHSNIRNNKEELKEKQKASDRHKIIMVLSFQRKIVTITNKMVDSSYLIIRLNRIEILILIPAKWNQWAPIKLHQHIIPRMLQL